jgi:hypothetical protein
MLKNETKTIDGHTYRVTQLPFKLGQKLLVRLYKTMGPVFAGALAAIPRLKEDQSLGDLNGLQVLTGLANPVTALADRLTEDELAYVTDTLMEYTELHKGGDRWIKLDKEAEFHFSGRYGAYLRWMGFALGVNYTNFFGESGGLDALIEKLKVLMAASRSPKGSTGTPTGSSPRNGTT